MKQVANHRGLTQRASPWQVEKEEMIRHRGPDPELPLMYKEFGHEFLTDKVVDSRLWYTAKHELNHIRAYWGEGGSPSASRITTHPDSETNSLGMMVFDGGHLNLDGITVTSMASSVPTTKGEVWGTGSDLAMAHVLHHWHGTISPEAARQRAAAHVRQNQAEWDEVGKALVYLQHQGDPPEKWTDGDKIRRLHDRVRYELQQKAKRKNENVTPARERDDETRAPMPYDKRLSTEVRYIKGQPYVVEVTYLTDQQIVEKFTSCGICFHKNGHSEWCSTVRKDKNRVSEWSNLVHVMTIMKKDTLLLDDLQEAGAVFADYYNRQDAQKAQEELQKSQKNIPKLERGGNNSDRTRGEAKKPKKSTRPPTKSPSI